MSSNPLAYADLSAVSDISYTGLDDTATGYSGGSSFDDPWLGSPLNLGGYDDSFFHSTTPDFINGEDPFSALALSGVSDPPFASSDNSTPYPNSSSLSSSAWAAFGSLSKFGNSIASLFGNHPTTIQPAAYPQSSINTGQAPVGGVTGTSTTILLVLVAAGIILLMRMED